MGKIHFWVILVVIMSELTFINGITEAEDSRWHIVLTEYGHDTVAVDTETIEYDKEANTLSYWTKTRIYRDVRFHADVANASIFCQHYPAYHWGKYMCACIVA